jgi:hypothetical protein
MTNVLSPVIPHCFVAGLRLRPSASLFALDLCPVVPECAAAAAREGCTARDACWGRQVAKRIARVTAERGTALKGVQLGSKGPPARKPRLVPQSRGSGLGSTRIRFRYLSTALESNFRHKIIDSSR